jgi:1-phosphofructokinase family hexose kinase
MSTVLETLYIALSPAVQRTTVYESLQVGAVNRATQTHVCAGGKAINALRAHHQLAGEGALFTLVGGAQGEEVVRLLAAEGLRQTHLKINGETRTCHTLVDLASAQTTELVEESYHVDEVELTALYEWLEEVSWSGQVAICGSVPSGIPAGIYGELVARAVRAGATVCLDAAGEALLNALESGPIVKINAGELLRTTCLTDRDEAAQAMLKRGAQALLITDAHRPAYLYEPENRYQVILPEADLLINTTGCGDAVMGGLLHQLAQGISFLEASIFGLACGVAASGTRLPAQLDLTRVEQVEKQLTATRF